MPPSRILVDTNTYLRLAHTINLLLGAPFGTGHCLYILPELERELDSLRAGKKRRKFEWTADAALAENRRHILQVSSGQRRIVASAYAQTQAYTKEESLKTSNVDVLYIAHGRALGLPVATDDQEMLLLLARAVAVDAMTTLELLRMMLDCGHVTMRTVDEICAHWERIDDLPANFRADYRRLFGRDDREPGKAP